MELKETGPEAYRDIFSHTCHVFNSVDFNMVTSEARQLPVNYLGFKTSGFKLGIIGSDAGGVFRSPFSAPFGGFECKSPDVSLADIEDATDLLIGYCKDRGMTAIELILPPVFYAPNFISKVSNVLYRKGFQQFAMDLNYSIQLDSMTNYQASLAYNARKNLNIAMTKPFHFKRCEDETEELKAFAIISQNRAARGFPLRMTMEAIRRSMSVTTADFFVLSLDDDPVAAALVFQVADGIVQVIYWGDLPLHSGNKCMNYLAYRLVEHYLQKGIRIIDVGPSTEGSKPNYGLCSFKESIGCSIYPKQSWRTDL